jgi:predicted phosphoribosyltransferase
MDISGLSREPLEQPPNVQIPIMNTPETPEQTIARLEKENASLKEAAIVQVIARLELEKAELKASTDQKIAQLERENSKINAQRRIVELGGIPEDIEGLVRAKMAVGLSQSQAIEVVRQQQAHDAAMAS